MPHLPMEAPFKCAERRISDVPRETYQGQTVQTIGLWLFCCGLAVCISAPLIDVLTRVAKGIEDMSDAQTQALADLSAAVDGMAMEVTAATGALSAALAKAATVAPMQPDDSAAIEAQVSRIKAATAALTAAVPAPVVVPVATPPMVAPAAPAPVAPAAS